MITVEDLRALHEEVESTPTRAGTAGALETAALIERVKQVYGQWLALNRARMLADEHYLRGASQRSLAEQVGVSVNAVSLWLKEHGPKQYLTVRQEGETFVLEPAKARSVRDLVAAGRRAAPSTWGLYDNTDGVTYQGSAEDLWHQLASQA